MQFNGINIKNLSGNILIKIESIIGFHLSLYLQNYNVQHCVYSDIFSQKINKIQFIE